MNTNPVLLTSKYVDVKRTETSVEGFEFAFRNVVFRRARKNQDDKIKSFVVTIFFNCVKEPKTRSIELKIIDKKLTISISTKSNSDESEEHPETKSMSFIEEDSKTEPMTYIFDHLIGERYNVGFAKRESSFLVYFLELPQKRV